MANMKFLIVLAIVAVLLNGVICHEDDNCQTDADCERDECCVKSYNLIKQSKVCKDKGDEIGERCGGLFQCNTCHKGLICEPDTNSFWNKLRKGTGSCRRQGRPFDRF